MSETTLHETNGKGGAGKPFRGDGSTLTTGAIARLCNVAPRTVSKWIDSGELKGHRLPGCQDRRVTREDLIAFMSERLFRIPPELVERVLFHVGPPLDGLGEMADALGLALTPCRDGLTAGLTLARTRGAIRLAVVSLALGRGEMLSCARLAKGHYRAPVVLVVGEDESELPALCREFDVVLQTPHSLVELAEALGRAMR
jgi:two-component system response regulator RpaA